MNTINPTLTNQAISYHQYHELMAQLVTHNQTPDYNEDMVNYTRMNIIRMERLDKTTRLQDPPQAIITAIKNPQLWLVLTEPWCGDAAQVLPVLHKLAALNPLVQMSLLMRDKHLDIMDAFLTKGARSIPKVIIIDPSNQKVLGSWGPRPFLAQGMMMRGIDQWRSMEEGIDKKIYHRNLYTKLQKWYARDKTYSTQEEFASYLVSLQS